MERLSRAIILIAHTLPDDSISISQKLIDMGFKIALDAIVEVDDQTNRTYKI